MLQWLKITQTLTLWIVRGVLFLKVLTGKWHIIVLLSRSKEQEPDAFRPKWSRGMSQMSEILILSYRLKEVPNSYVLHCFWTSKNYSYLCNQMSNRKLVWSKMQHLNGQMIYAENQNWILLTCYSFPLIVSQMGFSVWKMTNSMLQPKKKKKAVFSIFGNYLMHVNMNTIIRGPDYNFWPKKICNFILPIISNILNFKSFIQIQSIFAP